MAGHIIALQAILFVVKHDLALSAFLGGLVCALPNVYFARQIFTKRRIAAAHTLLRSVFVAEFIKMAFSHRFVGDSFNKVIRKFNR